MRRVAQADARGEVHRPCRRWGWIAGVALLAAACGNDPSRGADGSAGVASLIDRSTTVGNSSFLISGAQSGGGVGAAVAVVEGDRARVGPMLSFGTSRRLGAPEVFPTGDGGWVLIANGCATKSSNDGDSSCSNEGSYVFSISKDGKGAEVGELEEANGHSRVVGMIDSTHAVVSQSVTERPTTEAPSDPQSSLYRQTFQTYDLVSGRGTPLAWEPPPAVVPSAVQLPAVRSFPVRDSCVVDDKLVVLDGSVVGTGMVTTLFVVPAADGGKPSSAPVAIPAGFQPTRLLCGAAIHVVMDNAPDRAVAVAPLDLSGRVGELDALDYGSAFTGLSYGPTSVLVTTESDDNGPPAPATIDGPPIALPEYQLFGYANGRWQRLPYAPLGTDGVWMSDDGTALLIRTDTVYKAVPL